MDNFLRNIIAAAVFTVVLLPLGYLILGTFDWQIMAFSGAVLFAFVLGQAVKDLL
jgi:hypothetical protein